MARAPLLPSGPPQAWRARRRHPPTATATARSAARQRSILTSGEREAEFWRNRGSGGTKTVPLPGSRSCLCCHTVPSRCMEGALSCPAISLSTPPIESPCPPLPPRYECGLPLPLLAACTACRGGVKRAHLVGAPCRLASLPSWALACPSCTMLQRGSPCHCPPAPHCPPASRRARVPSSPALWRITALA